MTPFLVTIILLDLSSLASAVNFTQVFESNELGYHWPSEASKTRALDGGTFDPQKMKPSFMAVYGTRIFISLEKFASIPATLVSLPTSSASSAPPKLTPFPSWDMHEKEDCNKIEEAKGLEVDSIGRLWVLDQGSTSSNCNAKLWLIDFANKDQTTKIIHRFHFRRSMHDFVLDEQPDGTFAYITRGIEPKMVVFSLERNQSWTVDTPEIRAFSIALSPKEPRQLYISKRNSNELYSIPVAALRNGTRTANPTLIGKWTAQPYRMLMDNHGTMHATFLENNYISSWNTSQPFAEQRFHEVDGLDTNRPFTFALDKNGTFWMMVSDDKREPRYMLLKAKISYISEASQEESVAENGAQKRILIDPILIVSILIISCAFFTCMLIFLIFKFISNKGKSCYF